MVKFDLSQVPLIERKNLGRTFLEAVERFYSDPENERRFQEWKKLQEVKNADEGRTAHDNGDNNGCTVSLDSLGHIHD